MLRNVTFRDSHLYQRTALVLCLDSCGKNKISGHVVAGECDLLNYSKHTITQYSVDVRLGL